MIAGRVHGWSIATLLTVSVVGLIVLLVVVMTVLDVRRARSIFRDGLEERAGLLARELHDDIGDYVYFAEVDALKALGVDL